MGETLPLLFGQTIQMFLVLLVAPAITGLTRRTKARFMRRQGAPIIQPYRDLIKLLRKEAVVAQNASWFFRSAPYAHSGVHLGGSGPGSNLCLRTYVQLGG